MAGVLCAPRLQLSYVSVLSWLVVASMALSPALSGVSRVLLFRPVLRAVGVHTCLLTVRLAFASSVACVWLE
jgi:hypothetical protein